MAIDVVADLHLHSKYSRAVSPQMTLPVMAQYAHQKGIELLATGDWTHPVWLKELRNFLEESEEGLFRVKGKAVSDGSANLVPNRDVKTQEKKETRFLLSVEIATIFSQNGKGRRIHQLIFVPSFKTAEKVNTALRNKGCNLSSDGRPIIGLSSKNLLSLVLEIDERSLIIPAHVWTPWFGIYGQMSGFNSLKEAYEDLAPYVYGIETGLSSDPEMNWQIKELQTRSILSFSDAHSPSKMGREATVFRLEELSYNAIREAIMQPSLKLDARNKKLDKEIGNLKIETQIYPRSSELQNLTSSLQSPASNKVLYTIEFYPEEGKYHYSGHRVCGITMTPEEQIAAHNICPVCKRPLTDGVMRRVEELVGSPSGARLAPNSQALHKQNSSGLVWITDTIKGRPPFVKIVPLLEIIAEAIGSSVASAKSKNIFDTLCKQGESEFHVLLQLPLEKIETIVRSVTSKEFAEKITDGIKKVRAEKIAIIPGFDGVYGTVSIWNDTEKAPRITGNNEEQTKLKF